MKEKEKVNIKIRRDKNCFYIRYGIGAEYYVVINKLPWSVALLLKTLVSKEYEAVIEAEEYTG